MTSRWDWPWTSDPPADPSQVLGLQASTNMPGLGVLGSNQSSRMLGNDSTNWSSSCPLHIYRKNKVHQQLHPLLWCQVSFTVSRFYLNTTLLSSTQTKPSEVLTRYLTGTCWHGQVNGYCWWPHWRLYSVFKYLSHLKKWNKHLTRKLLQRLSFDGWSEWVTLFCTSNEMALYRCGKPARWL